MANSSLPVVGIAFGEQLSVTVFAAVAAIGIVVLHRQNVQRLIAGTENRIELRALVRKFGDA